MTVGFGRDFFSEEFPRLEYRFMIRASEDGDEYARSIADAGSPLSLLEMAVS